MPQFEQVDTFISQILWLVVSFGLLYLIMVRIIMPRLAEVIEGRQDKIEDDLMRAETLRKEADELLGEYEAGLSDAREKGHKLLRQAALEAKQHNTESLKALSDSLSTRLQASEAEIAAAKQAALGEIKDLSEELAGIISQKLAGVKPDAALISKAVERGWKEAG